MRVILYTGKGGVGKTSIAAATALRAAEMGHRTIIFSTDAAHSLADSLDTALNGDPRQVAPNLWAQEIDVLLEMGRHWKTVQDWLATFLQWRGLDELLAEEIAIPPGADEMAGLLYITRYHDSSDYDLVVVDCAPTGETLRLLSFPEMARWYMEKVFPMEKRLATALRPLGKKVLGVPVPGAEVFDSIEFLFQQLDRMNTILKDPAIASVRLVVNAEKMVIKETQRTYTYLSLHGYSSDLVVCNRVLPQDLDHGFFDSWKESQARYYELIQESFAPLPIRPVPLLAQEVVGMDALRQVADHLFAKDDPAAVFYLGRPQEVHREGDFFILELPLPFTQKEEIDITRNGSELVVKAGRHKRNLFLPRTLATQPVVEAKFVGDKLRVKFAADRPKVAGRRRGT